MANYNYRKNAFEDLDITRDELNQIGEALKKEEFRKLLNDYVEEVTDPENRKLYESEITQLEKERGVDVTFIHPTPGYVIKTSVDGKQKAFINVCENDNIAKPIPSFKPGGVHWSIPYCQAPPREDIDNKKNLCMVYDVVFHPEAIRMTKNNLKFKELVNDTALNAVEESFQVVLDKKNVRYPKISFKGMKQPTVIRKKSKCPPSPPEDSEDQGTFNIPNYPYSVPPDETIPRQSKMPTEVEKSAPYTTPKYVIKQRSSIELQEFTNTITSKMNAAIPSELVVEIELPLLKTSADVSILDVSEKRLSLVSDKPAKYKLEINLPYSVIEDEGNAKFDSRTKKLIVTLGVRRSKTVHMYPELSREDSGVDSDVGSGNRSTESSCSEDEPLKSERVLNGDNKSTSIFKPQSGEEEMSKGLPQVCETYRTNKVNQFLLDEIHYSFPPSTCNVLENLFGFTLHVRNVEPSSVEHKYFNKSGFHLKFTSIGAGFFPTHYAFCVKFPDHVSIDTNSLSIEVWDNNVIAQVKLIACDTENLIDYFYGKDEESLEKVQLNEPATIYKLIEEVKETGTTDTHETTEVKTIKNEEENVVFEITKSKNEIYPVEETAEEEKEEAEVSVGVDFASTQSPAPSTTGVDSSKPRTINGCDKIVASPSAPIQCGKKSSHASENRRPLIHNLSESLNEGTKMKPRHRGILKVGRSLSESNVDDFHWSPSLEDNVDEPGSSLEKAKKTVRFSDAISKKTFRSNCSILSQRKKNQRKSKNKKRAQERRMSESENSECENECIKNDEDDGVFTKSDDETSETQSDISESDDGLKVVKPDEMSLSRGNPHKRGGKKSARKSASTAKMAFTNNLMFDLDM